MEKNAARNHRQRRTFAAVYASIIVATDTLIQAEEELRWLGESHDVLDEIHRAVEAARAAKEAVQ